MTAIEHGVEKITKNWDTFKTQAYKGAPGLFEFNVKEKEEQSIMLAPASTKLDYVCAYPGGLVEHSLRVLAIMAKLRQAYGNLANKVESSSLVRVALFHDIGKTGLGSNPYYLDQKSEWHRNKLGQMYEVNSELACWPVAQLSLMWLATKSIGLTAEEWYAISSVKSWNEAQKGIVSEGPNSSEPMLAVMLHQAIKIASIEGHGKLEVSLIS